MLRFLCCTNSKNKLDTKFLMISPTHVKIFMKVLLCWEFITQSFFSWNAQRVVWFYFNSLGKYM